MEDVVTYPRPSARIWFALWGAAAAWAVQGLSNWFFDASACFQGVPTPWGSLSGGAARAIGAVVSAAALLVALAAFGTAFTAFRRSHERSVRVIEARERPDFIIAGALFVSTAFVLAIVWAAIAQLALPPCQRVR